MSLAVQNAFLFLSLNCKKEIVDAYIGLYLEENIPVWLGHIGLGHTLLSAILIFLIALGVRNKLKIS